MFSKQAGEHGIGISALMAENLRPGFIWSNFMRNPEATRAMQLVGFQRRISTR